MHNAVKRHKSLNESIDPVSLVSHGGRRASPAVLGEAVSGATAGSHRDRDEAFSKAVLDQLGDAVSVNVGMTRVYVNDAYLNLYGLKDKSEAVGHAIDEHLAPKQKK